MHGMHGMHQAHAWAFAYGDELDFTLSSHYELPPTSCLAQLSLSSYEDLSVEGNVKPGSSYARLAITHAEPQQTGYFTNAIAINGLTRLDWQVVVHNCFTYALLNIFFWDSVSVADETGG